MRFGARHSHKTNERTLNLNKSRGSVSFFFILARKKANQNGFVPNPRYSSFTISFGFTFSLFEAGYFERCIWFMVEKMFKTPNAVDIDNAIAIEMTYFMA